MEVFIKSVHGVLLAWTGEIQLKSPQEVRDNHFKPEEERDCYQTNCKDERLQLYPVRNIFKLVIWCNALIIVELIILFCFYDNAHINQHVHDCDQLISHRFIGVTLFDIHDLFCIFTFRIYVIFIKLYTLVVVLLVVIFF